MTYAITGASGHIGYKIAEILLNNKKTVRVIARDAAKLQPLAAAGAEVCTGTVENRAFLSKAFDKVDAVFMMIPPNPVAADFRGFQTCAGTALAGAVEKAGVRWVVNLSSQGAHLPSGNGPIAGLYEQEQRLNASMGAHVVHLRPTFFMENVMLGMDLIRNQNINGTPMRGDLVFPMIATRDIATVAANYLLALKFTGKSVRDLLGERDLSMTEVTTILGRAIGKPDLAYVQFPYDVAEKAMISMGMSASLAGLFTEMYHAFNEGRIMHNVRRTPDNTTPTSFETFAQEFAAAYKKA